MSEFACKIMRAIRVATQLRVAIGILRRINILAMIKISPRAIFLFVAFRQRDKSYIATRRRCLSSLSQCSSDVNSVNTMIIICLELDWICPARSISLLYDLEFMLHCLYIYIYLYVDFYLIYGYCMRYLYLSVFFLHIISLQFSKCGESLRMISQISRNTCSILLIQFRCEDETSTQLRSPRISTLLC